jgi:hypothetical protein
VGTLIWFAIGCRNKCVNKSCRKFTHLAFPPRPKLYISVSFCNIIYLLVWSSCNRAVHNQQNSSWTAYCLIRHSSETITVPLPNLMIFLAFTSLSLLQDHNKNTVSLLYMLLENSVWHFRNSLIHENTKTAQEVLISKLTSDKRITIKKQIL